jgi:hypothetical protein
MYLNDRARQLMKRFVREWRGIMALQIPSAILP